MTNYKVYKNLIMKKLHSISIVLLVILAACNTGTRTKPDSITVACYYFPNYHIRGKNHLPISRQPYLDNQSEWDLVRGAKPRFEGHQQPKVPAWGYTDEKDPAVMAMKIDAAADNGVNVFIFDWYNYNGQPFLNQCLDEGFLKAKNTNKLKFALMWANHNWTDLFPYSGGASRDVMYSGAVTAEAFDKLGDEIVRNYFTQSNYWLIDGKAYFSIYDIQKFVEGFGSVEATVKAMDMLDDKAKKAGLKGVHWNIVAWGTPILPGTYAPKNAAELINELHFASATSYVWIHHAYPGSVKIVEYNEVRDTYFKYWDEFSKSINVPYYPNVTMGWDSSPRTNQSMGWDPQYGYPYTGIIVNNTPGNFRTALQKTKDKMLSDPKGPRILNINCWNEWTEGSYLEPDAIHGMAYLEAVKEVFRKE
jgi:hypothetical protein